MQRYDKASKKPNIFELFRAEVPSTVSQRYDKASKIQKKSLIFFFFERKESGLPPEHLLERKKFDSKSKVRQSELFSKLFWKIRVKVPSTVDFPPEASAEEVKRTSLFLLSSFVFIILCWLLIFFLFLALSSLEIIFAVSLGKFSSCTRKILRAAQSAKILSFF